MAKNKTRYFLISYYSANNFQVNVGNMTVNGEEFPNQKFIQSHIFETTKIENPVIQNIFEFKSLEDYNEFLK